MKNDVVDCVVDNLGIYGEGIAHVEGRTVFIPGALTRERVRAKIVFEKPTFCHAKLEKILETSPDRIRPVCPAFGACGGCALQHMTYAAELAYKKSRLDETLKKVAGIDFDSAPPVPSPQRVRYRNKLSLPVRAGRDGKAVLGFFARGSHRVVPITDCFLQPEWVKTIIAATHAFMASSGLSGFDETTGGGDIRHVTAREIEGRLMLTVVASHGLGAQEKALVEAFSDVVGPEGSLYTDRNAKNTNVIYGPDWKRLSGGETAVEVDGVLMDVHPASFFQVNDSVRRALYDAVVEACGTGVVVDAYAGAGLLTARLAAKCRHAVGLELDPSAAAAARKTVALNALGNVDCLEGDCAVLLPQALERFPDADVVLDPPRQGVDERVVRALGESRVKRTVYVSCDPATLARDVARLREYGFALTYARVFDMFPMTASMECFTVLKRP